MDDYTNSNFVTKTTTTTTTKKESTVKNTYAKPQKTKPFIENDSGPVVKANISDKKSVVKMDPVKDFGSFSILNAPALLSGNSLILDTIWIHFGYILDTILNTFSDTF